MMVEPKQITAGLSYAWTKSLPKYKASAGWTLAYSITSINAQYDVTVVANGDDFDASILKADSEKFEAGGYKLIGYVDDGTDRFQVFCNDLTVFPDFTGAADLRSFAESTLEAIEAMIAGSAGKDQQSVTVDGQTLVRRTVADLIVLRDRFQREVRAEKRAADLASGIGKPGRVQVRFK
jgi:hypothetical protein